MADEQIAVEQTPVQDNVVAPQVEVSPVVEQETVDSILSRVTKKKEQSPQDTSGTFKEFDDISDPVLRQKMIDREKSRIADYTRKTQEISRERERLENQLKDMENWTPEKVQNYLLKNPTFLQAAQQIAQQPGNPAGSGLTDEQFSALTPAEKSQLTQMSQQIGQLQQQNFLAAISQKDALLQAKYGDYDSLKINQGIQDLSRMNPIDIREHAYKALFHDDHVKSAYEEGKKYRDNLDKQRMQASTSSGSMSTLPASDVPKKEKGENDINYFARIAQRRIDQAKGRLAASK